MTTEVDSSHLVFFTKTDTVEQGKKVYKANGMQLEIRDSIYTKVWKIVDKELVEAADLFAGETLTEDQINFPGIKEIRNTNTNPTREEFLNSQQESA